MAGLISISLANNFVPVSYDTDGIFTQLPVGCFFETTLDLVTEGAELYPAQVFLL